MNKKTDALIIMDGLGEAAPSKYNAVTTAGTPTLDELKKLYAHTLIDASGVEVGLPAGQMGNSEVGHLNMGAGRVVHQDISRIDMAIKSGEFFTNPAFLAAIDNVKKNDSSLHLVGLLGDGGVHSSINHLFALIKLAADHGIKKLWVHCITDGRDTTTTSGVGFIRRTEEELKRIGVGKIATIVGRYYYMDRDSRWDRVKTGYDCVFAGVGRKFDNAVEAIETSYAEDKTDEYVLPFVRNGYTGIRDGDSLIFYNFRADRAREITRAAIEPDFNEFKREGGYKKICYVGMTQYDVNFRGLYTAFGPKDIKNTLGEYLSKKGKTQCRIAETEKYAHVTFFFNGGREKPDDGEQRIFVASPKVATYDIQPEMSAYEVTEKALSVIGKVDVLIMNFANCDMVGHTGNFDATVKAVRTVDECVKKVVDAVLASGGKAIVTADHGNAEEMADEKGEVITAHTTNKVSFIVAGYNGKIKSGGALCDVAPTFLKIMGLDKPEEMEGQSLI